MPFDIPGKMSYKREDLEKKRAAKEKKLHAHKGRLQLVARTSRLMPGDEAGD